MFALSTLSIRLPFAAIPEKLNRSL